MNWNWIENWNIAHAPPVPVYSQTDLTPKRVVISRLHDTVARFCTGVKFSPRDHNRGELTPGWLAPAWHFVESFFFFFDESAWERWGFKKLPKTCFMDFSLLYENDEGEYVVLKDVCMADIRLASLVYKLALFTLARIACLLHFCVKTSRFDFLIWTTPK